MMNIHYDYSLVMGSIVVALLTCYFAVYVEQFLFRSIHKKMEKIVLLLSGAILGVAIWCMHFVGMLACHLPAESSFEPVLTFVSYLIAFFASTFAIWLTTRPTLSLLRLILGSILMGLGIGGMHYTGMMGLIVEGYKAIYNPVLVLLSILIAISCSGLSFWLTFKYKKWSTSKASMQMAIAFFMALAIVGMHYTGMLAVSFQETSGMSEILNLHTMSVFLTILFTSLLLTAAFGLAVMDQRLEERSKQLSQLNRQLANQNLHDHVTSLPNRLYLQQYAKLLFQHKQQKFCFLYIDIDQFKNINEAFGHEIGDQLLKQISARLHRHLSSEQKLLHIGADEFLLVLENATVDQAKEMAERFLESLRVTFLISWKDIHVTASIGIAVYPEHGQNLHDLMTNADNAMLNAKFQGRNTYSIFSYSFDHEQLKAQSHLMNDLYKAVDNQQFILYYQPKYSAKDQRICGVEALIRWNHPSQGLLMPNMFIELAEQNGAIIQMGYWALEQACQQIQIWEQQGRDCFPLAVNLSSVQFAHRHLLSTLERLFAEYNIRASHLMIEVTESTAMYNIDLSLDHFKKLREMGIQLAIDDFGTGYSSFLYLKKLPIHEVKIDRGFILDLMNSAKSELILESIIELSTKLGLIVTAEGVETPEQAQALTRLGCTQLQGFLFAKPLCLEKFEQHLNEINAEKRWYG